MADVQKAQRRAAIGTVLKHSGQAFVVGSGGACPLRTRAIKYLAEGQQRNRLLPISRANEITAFANSPMRNLLPLTVKKIFEKSGFPTAAAMIGVIKSLTSAVTTAPNAVPMHYSDGQINNIAAHQKRLESLHLTLQLSKLKYTYRKNDIAAVRREQAVTPQNYASILIHKTLAVCR